MIRRSLQLLITFHTTTDAMAMEQRCRSEGLPGRLIPVPGFITADCGLAWCAPPESETILTELLRREGLPFQAIHLCQI